ncbi:MAG: SGNH hydrolase domain-containing protein [Pseudomonadota bacterium]
MPGLIALSVILSVLSYRFLEQPCRRRVALRLLLGGLASSAGALTCIALVFLFAAQYRPLDLPFSRWAERNLDPEILAYLSKDGGEQGCGDRTATGFRHCPFGTPGQPVSFVLWGDSLAGAMLPGLDSLASARGFAGEAYYVPGCPPVTSLHMTTGECDAKTHARILDSIAALPAPALVIITGNFDGAMRSPTIRIAGAPASTEAVQAKVTEAVQRLQSLGHRVVIVEQGPVFPEPVAQAMLLNTRNGSSSVPFVPLSDHLATVVGSRLLAEPADLYIPTDQFFCDANACPALGPDGRIVIYDRNHVTRHYSEKLAEFVADRAGL